jgi:hypothetical protein
MDRLLRFERPEEHRVAPAGIAAAGALDEHHVGAEVREDEGRERAGVLLGQAQHTDAGERCDTRAPGALPAGGRHRV